MSAMLSAWIPLIVGIALILWGGRLQSAARKFKMPPSPLWPFAQNPGLAL